jgi:hypothetical protein
MDIDTDITAVDDLYSGDTAADLKDDFLAFADNNRLELGLHF